MASELETAEEFAEKVTLLVYEERVVDSAPICTLVEQRDAAVTRQVCERIEKALAGFYLRNPQHPWTQVVPATIREILAGCAPLTKRADGGGAG